MFNRLFGSLAVVAVCASGCVSVDAEVPEVVVTRRDLGFEALPIAGLPAQALAELMKERTVEVPPFSFEHGPVELPEGLSSSVRTIGVQLVANRGIEDFTFIRKMEVTINDGKNPPLSVASFDRDKGDTTETNTLTFKTISAADTLSMWQTDVVTFSMTLTGTPPMDAWSMDVVARFSGELAFDL